MLTEGYSAKLFRTVKSSACSILKSPTDFREWQLFHMDRVVDPSPRRQFFNIYMVIVMNMHSPPVAKRGFSGSRGVHVDNRQFFNTPVSTHVMATVIVPAKVRWRLKNSLGSAEKRRGKPKHATSSRNSVYKSPRPQEQKIFRKNA